MALENHQARAEYAGCAADQEPNDRAIPSTPIGFGKVWHRPHGIVGQEHLSALFLVERRQAILGYASTPGSAPIGAIELHQARAQDEEHGRDDGASDTTSVGRLRHTRLGKVFLRLGE